MISQIPLEFEEGSWWSCWRGKSPGNHQRCSQDFKQWGCSFLLEVACLVPAPEVACRHQEAVDVPNLPSACPKPLRPALWGSFPPEQVGELRPHCPPSRSGGHSTWWRWLWCGGRAGGTGAGLNPAVPDPLVVLVPRQGTATCFAVGPARSLFLGNHFWGPHSVAVH